MTGAYRESKKTCTVINEKEALSDPFTVEITALLHDTADSNLRERTMRRVIC